MREDKKKVVLTFWTFDRLHLGHQYYLSQAREYGDYVVTIVARDSTVLKVKGRLPFSTEDQRLENLKKTARSDEVVLGREDWFDWCLDYYQPDVICMGYDQGDVSGRLKAEDWTRKGLKIVRIAPYMPDKWKSSLLKQK